MPDQPRWMQGRPVEDPTTGNRPRWASGTPAAPAQIPQVEEVTEQNYADLYRREAEALDTAAKARGEERLSQGARLALLDQYKRRAGLPGMLKTGQEDMDERIEQKSKDNSVLKQYSAGVLSTLGETGERLIGTVAPETANDLAQSRRLEYGDPRGIAGKAGTVIGTVGKTIAAAQTGAIGMAGLFGGEGFGGVRQDVADRRSRGQEISDAQEFGAAAATGTLDALTGYIGGKLFGSAGKKLGGLPGLKEIFQSQGLPGVVTVIRKIAPEMLSQGGQEGLNTLADNLVKKYIYAPEQDVTEGVVESAIMGAGLTPIVGAAGNLQAKARGAKTETKTDSKGVTFNGPQTDADGKHVFDTYTDNQTGTSFSVKPGQSVEAALEQARSRFSDENLSDEQLAAKYPDLVKGDEPGFDTKAGRKIHEDAHEQIRKEADAAETEQAQRKTITPDEIIERVAKDHPEQAEAVRTMIDRDAKKGGFVEVEVPLSDIDVKGIIDEAKEGNAGIRPNDVRKYAEQSGETAPGVIATSHPSGGEKLYIADGRHRVLAAALREQKGKGTQSIKAVVPEAWAKAKGLSAATSEGPRINEGMPTMADASRIVESMRSARPTFPRLAGDVQAEVKGPSSPVDLPEKVAPSVAELPTGKSNKTNPVATLFEWADANRPKDWVRQSDRVKGTKELAQLDVKRGVTNPLQKLAKIEGLNLDDRAVQYQIKKALVDPSARKEAMPKAVNDWVASTRKQIDDASTELAKAARELGMDDWAKAVEANLGNYLPGVWMPKIKTLSGQGGMKQQFRMREDMLHVKRDQYVVTGPEGVEGKFKTHAEALNAAEALRKKLPIEQAVGVEIHEPIPEFLRMENEVHDPRFLAAKAIVDAKHNTELFRLLKVAKPYARSAPKDMSEAEVQQWAKENGLEQLPRDAKLGPLSNKFLPTRMASDLTEFYHVPSMAMKMYLGYLGAWKLSKTVMNLPTHGHNIVSNFIFSAAAGNSPFNPMNWNRYKASLRETANRSGEDWRYLAEHNAVGTGGKMGAEIGDIMRAAYDNYDAYYGKKIKWAVRKGLDAMKAVYSAEDDVFRLSTYKKYKAEGLTNEQALAKVRETMPDASRTSKWAKILRQSPFGAPFVAFTDQAIRVYAKHGIAAKKGSPYAATVLAGIYMLPWLLDEYAKKQLGVNPQEEKLINQNRTWAEPMLPWRDPEGRVSTLDLRYILPLVNDVVPQMRGTSLQLPGVLSGPATNLIVEQLSGIDRFTGKPFLRENMTDGEQAKARFTQAFKTTAPVPSAVQYGIPEVVGAAKKQNERVLSYAVLNQLTGVNIRTPYIAERAVRKIVYNMMKEGEIDQAHDVVERWNKEYKPGNLADLQIPDLVKGMRAGLREEQRQAREKAAEAMLGGDDAEAKRIIKEYNDGRAKDTPALELSAVKEQLAKYQQQNRTR